MMKDAPALQLWSPLLEWIDRAVTHDGEFADQARGNCAALAIFVAFCGWTVLTIDQPVARGWTAAEVALNIPRDNWSAYTAALREMPVLTKTEINVFIYLIGDYAAQTDWGKKHFLNFDLMRTVRNGAIGACFGPMVSVYYDFSDWILPPEVLSNAPKKIFMDQTAYLATKTTIYLTLTGLLSGKRFDDITVDVQGRLWTILTAAWKFWPFVHCITYSVIPPLQRILWVNCVDLVWSSILSGLALEEGEGAQDGQGESAVAGRTDDDDTAVKVGQVEDNKAFSSRVGESRTGMLEDVAALTESN